MISGSKSRSFDFSVFDDGIHVERAKTLPSISRLGMHIMESKA
jgi:hypothetical protein